MDSGNSSNNTRPLREKEGWEGRREREREYRGSEWVVVGRKRSESDKEREKGVGETRNIERVRWREKRVDRHRNGRERERRGRVKLANNLNSPFKSWLCLCERK